MFEKITSHSNPKVKNLVKLGKGRGKERKDLFIFEGIIEIQLALRSGLEIESVFFCRDFFNENLLNQLAVGLPQSKIFEVSADIFGKIAYRDTTGGLLIVARTRYLKLSDIKLRSNPFIIVLESVEKPGNLGGILRTADAAKVDAVIICDPLTDLFNPNVIRSSIGCIFTTPVVACTSDEALQWLKSKDISVYATDLATNFWYHQLNYNGPVAIVMGTESTGLSAKWLQASDYRIKIPMLGEIDSLNVSTSTAIVVFEAMRQRNFKV